MLQREVAACLLSPPPPQSFSLHLSLLQGLSLVRGRVWQTSFHHRLHLPSSIDHHAVAKYLIEL